MSGNCQASVYRLAHRLLSPSAVPKRCSAHSSHVSILEYSKIQSVYLVLCVGYFLFYSAFHLGYSSNVCALSQHRNNLPLVPVLCMLCIVGDDWTSAVQRKYHLLMITPTNDDGSSKHIMN